MPRTVHRALNRGKSDSEDDITLVTQLSSSRYDKLLMLILRWSGKSIVTTHFYLNTMLLWGI